MAFLYYTIISVHVITCLLLIAIVLLQQGKGQDLASAFEGDVTAAISDLDEPENAFERASYDRLIETYAPIRALGTGEIVAVSEFYQLPDALLSDIAAARLRGWLVVASATIVMYLALMGMVRKASATISRQRDELVDNVRRLETALAMNARLQRRVERAAERTATRWSWEVTAR